LPQGDHQTAGRWENLPWEKMAAMAVICITGSSDGIGLATARVLVADGHRVLDWIGREVVIGDTVRLAITEPCPRCVMITLPQGDLPKDSGILRTAAQHNGVNVGVYASVINGGTIRRGDAVVLA
jgi:NAD(P)-dependent dehydrogenase (short-subunit alcohol dehydrogenase family)